MGILKVPKLLILLGSTILFSPMMKPATKHLHKTLPKNLQIINWHVMRPFRIYYNNTTYYIIVNLTCLILYLLLWQMINNYLSPYLKDCLVTAIFYKLILTKIFNFYCVGSVRCYSFTKGYNTSDYNVRVAL